MKKHADWWLYKDANPQSVFKGVDIREKNVYFSALNELGDLYLEYIFLEFEQEPILFICKDIQGNMYFCLCSDMLDGYVWVLAECSMQSLKELIDKKKSLLEFFRQKESLFRIQNNQETDLCEKTTPDKIDPLELPEQEVYLEWNQSEFKL